MQDSDLAINTLIDMMNDCINTATTKQRLKNKLPRKNWITSAIMISYTTKETLYTLWKNNPTSEEYTNYTKILSKVIKDTKFKYEKDIIKRNDGNSRELWNIIKTKLGKS